MSVDRMKFFAGRLLGMIVVLLVLAFVMFCLQRYTPADPVRVKFGANANAGAGEGRTRSARVQRPVARAVRQLRKGLGARRSPRLAAHPASRDHRSQQLRAGHVGAHRCRARIGFDLRDTARHRLGGEGARLERAARRDGRGFVGTGVLARADRPARCSTGGSAGCPRPAGRSSPMRRRVRRSC